MKLHLLNQNKSGKTFSSILQVNFKKISYLLPAIMLLCSAQTFAQGKWKAVSTLSPNSNGGGLLLLSDGSVLCKSFGGGTDGIGNIYDRLTPNKKGDYSKGKWTSIAPMAKTRLYYSSQVLKDGRVYVAGGEYGTGGGSGETYNPVSNKWKDAPAVGVTVSDANSEIVEDGRVVQALVSGTLRSTKVYDPVANTYSAGPTCLGIHNESVWVKLPDNSILMVDRGSTSSERLIPSTGTWVADATVPVSLYDPYGLETGGALLLPNGKAFFIGSLGHCAIYTPSGTALPGSWVAAADIPNSQGTPDAAAAMLVNGKVLLATSAKPTSGNHFPSPTSYYLYDYTSNTFTRILSPDGDSTDAVPCYYTNMLALPSGQVLFGLQGSNQYYVYTPSGSPVASGKPTISSITSLGNRTYQIIGTLFNGISEGATYGDDWQMNSNYPIVSLSAGGSVYYARTYNWNSTGVMRGSSPDTAYFQVSKKPLPGTYSLVVSANGIASDSAVFVYSGEPVAQTSDASVINRYNAFSIYPNPVKNEATVQFAIDKTSNVILKVVDVNGKVLKEFFSGTLQQGSHSIKLNVSEFSAGVYFVNMTTESGTKNIKLIVQ